MIEKKNSRFDLERKRFVLLQIGLLTAGSLTLAAFTYTKTIIIEHEKQTVVSELIDIETFQLNEKVEDQSQKQETKQSEPQISQQSDPIPTTIKVSKSTSTAIKSGIIGELGIPKGPGDLGTMIDVAPEDDLEEFPKTPTHYIGGLIAMREFINETVSYPQVDIEFGTQGRVFLSFIVEKDGSISNIEIVRGVSPTLDREAKRIVRKFPNWKPAEDAYGPVRTRVQLPINFTLSQ